MSLRADTEQDSQDLWMGYPLGQGRVEAAAAYLDEGEMECRRVGDRLDVIKRSEVGIGSGNCRMLPSVQARDRLRKIRLGVSKIGVKVAAAIPRPPTCVDFELREIGEPFPNFFWVDPCRRTA